MKYMDSLEFDPPFWVSSNESMEAIRLGLQPREGDQILAVCGSLEQSLEMIYQGAKVTAVDINPAQITYAKASAELINNGEFAKFLDILRLTENNPFYIRQRPISEEARRRTNFPQEKLEKIRGNIKNLRIETAMAIEEYFNINSREFNKIYLSNALRGLLPTSMYPKTAAKINTMAQKMHKGDLIYFTQWRTIGLRTDETHLYQPTQGRYWTLDKELTEKARESERLWCEKFLPRTDWKPSVLRVFNHE